jgi:hypothetical protein
MTNPDADVHVHQGLHLINILPFIPKTKQNTEYQASIVDLGRLDNLERWFLNNMDLGARNNTLHSFAMMLFDAGMKYDQLSLKVNALNERCASPLKKDEVESTVLKSVGAKYTKK